jgi:hypothetical protein
MSIKNGSIVIPFKEEDETAFNNLEDISLDIDFLSTMQECFIEVESDVMLQGDKSISLLCPLNSAPELVGKSMSTIGCTDQTPSYEKLLAPEVSDPEELSYLSPSLFEDDSVASYNYVSTSSIHTRKRLKTWSGTTDVGIPRESETIPETLGMPRHRMQDVQRSLYECMKRSECSRRQLLEFLEGTKPAKTKPKTSRKATKSKNHQGRSDNAKSYL